MDWVKKLEKGAQAAYETHQCQLYSSNFNEQPFARLRPSYEQASGMGRRHAQRYLTCPAFKAVARDAWCQDNPPQCRPGNNKTQQTTAMSSEETATGVLPKCGPHESQGACIFRNKSLIVLLSRAESINERLQPMIL